jgi:hypothetical protein
MVMMMNVDRARLEDRVRYSKMCPYESIGLKFPNPYTVVKKMKTEQTTDAIDHIIYLK